MAKCPLHDDLVEDVKAGTPWKVFIWAASIVTVSVLGCVGLTLNVRAEMTDLHIAGAVREEKIDQLRETVARLAEWQKATSATAREIRDIVLSIKREGEGE